MGVRVKICGLANAADTASTLALGPDAMGFICTPKSPRQVRPEDVAEWPTAGVTRVGVFVDESVEALLAAGDAGEFNVLQLHRVPDFLEFAELRAAWDGELWLAVNAAHTDLGAVVDLGPDAVLLDSGTSEQPGGTGKVGRWDLAREWVEALDVPVWLAGGLHPGNVQEAIAAVQPFGVDVSSGVEARPGHKDLEKVREFLDKGHSS